MPAQAVKLARRCKGDNPVAAEPCAALETNEFYIFQVTGSILIGTPKR